MAFLILLFFLLFPHPVFAIPQIKITDFSSNSDQEWIQLTNTTNENINLTNWLLKDKANNSTSINICLSPNSTQNIINSSTWLNNTGGDTIYLYDSTQNLIDELSYTTGVDKIQPSNTNTCVLPTPTLTPTIVPTNTPTPTIIPTSDPTIINPTSGISLTEFMPYSKPEWIEIYNSNDKPIKLVSWKIEDNDGNTENIDNLSIPAKGYKVYELKSLIFDNNDTDKIIFRNQDSKPIGNDFSYSKGLMTTDRSWSLINGNWCQSSITYGYENVTSCYTTPTNTPTPSATPTPDPNTDTSKYTSTATESAIIEPKSESSFLSPTTTSATPTATSGAILGDSDTNNAKKRNYLPLILIIGGGLLLVSPAVITKIKSKNEKNN